MPLGWPRREDEAWTQTKSAKANAPESSTNLARDTQRAPEKTAVAEST